MTADLSGLREGDEIAIMGSGYVPSIRRVARVYKRHLVDDLGCKWRLDNGD